MKTLFDYQEVEVDRLARDSHSAFFAWEMGLGKTLAAVEWVRRKREQGCQAKTVIVVLPLNTVHSWEETIQEQFPGQQVYNLRSDKKNVLSFTALQRQSPGWYLITWEMMRSGALTGMHGDVIIADETHRQANLKSQQAANIRHITSHHRAALSGTPAGNKPEYIYSTMNWLWPELYRSYYKNFVDVYWYTQRDGAVISFLREKKPGQILKDMPAFSRLLRNDHRDDMPPVLPEIVVTVEITPGQRKIYNQFEAKSLAWLGDTPMPSAYSLVKDIRLKQVALGVPSVEWVTKPSGEEVPEVTFDVGTKSSKIVALKDIIADQPEEDTFLVLVHSARFVPAVVEQLRRAKIPAEAYLGETKSDERTRLVKELGTTYRVLVAGIAAIGTGTDGLQYVCHNMVWMSKHPDALLNTQASGRLDRPGQKEPINVWNIVAIDTKDEATEERLEIVKGNMDELLDNHR